MSKKNKENTLQEAISVLKSYIYTTYEPKLPTHQLNEAVIGAIVNHLRFNSKTIAELQYPYDELNETARNDISVFVFDNLSVVQYRNPFESEFVESDGNSCLNAFLVVAYNGKLYEIAFGVDSWNQVWQECGNTYRIKEVKAKTVTQTIYE